FEAAGRTIGRARVKMTVALNGESDAFQDVIPVEVLVSPETVSAIGDAGEGARYLVEYPYGCAEQRGSRTLALLLSADLGEAFKLPGVEAAQIRPAVQTALGELERFQCTSGGFAY